MQIPDAQKPSKEAKRAQRMEARREAVAELLAGLKPKWGMRAASKFGVFAPESVLDQQIFEIKHILGESCGHPVDAPTTALKEYIRNNAVDDRVLQKPEVVEVAQAAVIYELKSGRLLSAFGIINIMKLNRGFLEELENQEALATGLDGVITKNVQIMTYHMPTNRSVDFAVKQLTKLGLPEEMLSGTIAKFLKRLFIAAVNNEVDASKVPDGDLIAVHANEAVLHEGFSESLCQDPAIQDGFLERNIFIVSQTKGSSRVSQLVSEDSTFAKVNEEAAVISFIADLGKGHWDNAINTIRAAKKLGVAESAWKNEETKAILLETIPKFVVATPEQKQVVATLKDLVGVDSEE